MQPTRILVLLFITACTSGSNDPAQDTPDAAAVAIDAPVVQLDCVGEHIQLRGAYALDVRSAAAVTVDGHVGAFVGASTPQSAYSLSLRDILTANLDALGTHDIATKPLKFRDKHVDATCPGAGCNGFFAMAGTFTVLEVQPRYRAMFELTDLRHHDGASSMPGAAMAGTITGCIDANR